MEEKNKDLKTVESVEGNVGMTDEELNEIILYKTVKKVNYLKYFQVICVAITLLLASGMITRIQTIEEKLNKTKERVEILEDSLGLKENERSDEEKAREFLNTDYVKNNTLDKNITIEELFELSDEEYYVFFYMEDCNHCIEAESKMKKFIDREYKSEMYFYDANNIDENTEIQFDEGESEKKMDVETFKFIGTPTMYKFKNGKATPYIGADAILKELKLQ